MKLSRDSWLALGLFVALVFVTIIAAIFRPQETGEAPPRLASFSNQPDGARALNLWLRDLGYTIVESTPTVYRIPGDVDIVLALEPILTYTSGPRARLLEWVDAGGTAIIVGEGFAARLLGESLGVKQASITTTTPSPVRAVAPLLLSPAFTEAPTAQPRVGLEWANATFTPLAAAGPAPVAVTFRRGQGRFVFTSLPYAFTNEGLKQAGNPELVLNLLSTSEGKRVWFDEWHHGVRADDVAQVAEPRGPEAWLQTTAAGRAILFTALIVFVMVLLQGQAFGRPVPLPQDMNRRAPLEYITAIANLSRRAGHREAVLAQYHQRLKRHLGKRYRLDPTLQDGEYVARLATYKPDLDKAALTNLLNRLRQPNQSEAELIQTTSEVARWTSE